jgi:hypothetical protein
MNKLQLWLMNKYCPDFQAKMPEDEPGNWRATAIVVSGYFGHRHKVVAKKEVFGLRNAYITARWLALKAQWKRPEFFCNCGISYGVEKLDLTAKDIREGLDRIRFKNYADSKDPQRVIRLEGTGTTIEANTTTGPWSLITLSAGRIDEIIPFKTLNDLHQVLKDCGYV